MRYHHTKSKGDLGLIHAMGDLAEKGWGILLPVTEHAAFDLVAFRGDRFLRVQVKYRAAVNGVITVPFKTCWADRHGIHTQPVDRNEVDLFSIYCPDTKICYYLDPSSIAESTISLRLEPTRNNNSKRVRWAKDHVEIPAVRGIPAGLRDGLEQPRFVRHSREPQATWLYSAHSSAG